MTKLRAILIAAILVAGAQAALAVSDLTKARESARVALLKGAEQ